MNPVRPTGTSFLEKSECVPIHYTKKRTKGQALYSVVGVTATAASSTAILLHTGENAGWEKFAHRETDLAEDLAGIVVAVLIAAAALSGGHTVVVDGDEELRISFQTNHGKLPQGDVKPAAAPVKAQLAVEAGADAGGDFGQLIFCAAAAARGAGCGRTATAGRGTWRWAARHTVARVQELEAEDDGIDRFDHGLRQIAPTGQRTIHAVGAIGGGENFGIPLTAKEDDPFVEDGKPADLGGTWSSDEGVGGDTVIVADVYAVKASIVVGWFYVNVGIEKLRPTTPNAEGTVNNRLGASGGIDPQVFNTIFVAGYSVL